jgi:hypothetical protein
MRKGARRVAVALGFAGGCAAWLIASTARAGNADAVYLSADAMLQGGAITADALGGGAIWYNPAGLARMPGLRVDVSVNAYALRFGGHPDFEGGQETHIERLQALDLNVVPASLTITRNFGPVGLGLGVFVPLQRKTFLRTQVVQDETAEHAGVNFGLDLYDTVQEYAAGPSIGIALHPAIDFGASLFINYRSILQTASVSGSSTAGGVETAFLSHATVDAQQLGAQLVLGVKLRPSRATKIGFTIRLPPLQFYELRQSVSQEASGDPMSPGGASFEQHSGFVTSVLSPPRFHAGISREFGRSRIAADVSYQSRLYASGREEDFFPTWNVRAGGRHSISETVAVGGGIFTDRSSARTPRFFGESKFHFYGVTAALEFGTPYVVSARGSKKLDPPGKMVFGTSIGLSYAIGLGDVVRGQVGGASRSEDVLFQEVSAQAIAHEITLHFGSTLME